MSRVAPSGTVWLAMACLIIAIAQPQRGSAQGQLSDQDRSQPIEIEADLLTLDQERSIAIFEGHVLAVQGEMSLKAQKLLVYYLAEGGESEQSIRQIDAEGDVVIASPRETATGTAGTYDVVGETMQLRGDVVLTRDGNVLRGDQLDIDLARNLHKLSSPNRTEGGRIRALFVPAAKAADP